MMNYYELKELKYKKKLLNNGGFSGTSNFVYLIFEKKKCEKSILNISCNKDKKYRILIGKIVDNYSSTEFKLINENIKKTLKDENISLITETKESNEDIVFKEETGMEPIKHNHRHQKRYKLVNPLPKIEKIYDIFNKNIKLFKNQYSHFPLSKERQYEFVDLTLNTMNL